MELADGGGRKGDRIERRENVLERAFEGLCDDFPSDLAGKGIGLIL